MWSTSSRSAHKQWVKSHREGGIVKTPRELRAHLGAKACTNGTVKLPLLSTPSQTAKIKLCNTILITHFYNFEVFHSIKTKIEVCFCDNTAYPCISPAHFQPCQTGKFCLICTEKPHCLCHLEISRGFSTHRLKQTWISENSSNPIFCYQNHTSPRLKTWVCKYSPQLSLK